jgi:hypothetical protein
MGLVPSATGGNVCLGQRHWEYAAESSCDVWCGWWQAFSLVFVSEIGDKTFFIAGTYFKQY